uniref:HepT-like domain-containing protein n=1 Tax=Ammonifex degensii TaxID=42838 RepID=A0A7C1FD23_9THEO
MDAGKVALLRAEIEKQIEVIERIFARVERRKEPKNTPSLESLGYQLHNLYCAFEDLFKIIARAFENEVADKARYHAELLRRMALNIEGVRPALFSDETVRLLDNLRAFRHFFRHAYGYELDPRRVEVVLEDALKLKERYRGEAEQFVRLLELELK